MDCLARAKHMWPPFLLRAVLGPRQTVHFFPSVSVYYWLLFKILYSGAAAQEPLPQLLSSTPRFIELNEQAPAAVHQQRPPTFSGDLELSAPPFSLATVVDGSRLRVWQ